MQIDSAKYCKTGLTGFSDRVRELILEYDSPDVLELGGGRQPRFRLDELPDNLNSYTVNDISESELALLPEGYKKACYDVCGDAREYGGRYDVVFSYFMAEHVPDGKALHRNVAQVLKPGGVAFHLIPTLYASPFVINKILPEWLSFQMIAAVNPLKRNRELSPKFPAPYSYCRGDTPRMRRIFEEAGYAEVEFEHFYGHHYYEKIPVVREIESLASGLAAQRDWTWYASYAYIMARK